ncbi:hypothetical protein DHEL01_v206608 [Diaporthe helianthi]|uniref:HpcH/HpaI aldolase/citrate lyase domain-containing protein n=1 Tax=Diaporthe helianthi TaxID=158607 RepID=A0A2P5HXK9_DIAHE|nr:hypothetical protein DHEL01_v206608 [Diaporthe helianthi]
MLTKSLGLTTDNVTYDLEDSVTPHEKPNARLALAKHLSALSSSPTSRPNGIGEVAARINAVSTPYALEDLQTLGREPGLEAIVVPKVNKASDLTFVADVLKHVAPQRYHNSQAAASSSSPPQQPIKLLALIESAEAILNLGSICQAGVSAGVSLSGLIFAAEDFSLDLSLTRTPSLREFLYARSAIATHARAFDLSSTIDLVCTTFRGDEGTHRLREECADGKGMGFNGKQCIHPSQVEIVQAAFAPSAEEIGWSVRVVVADEKARKGDRAGESGRGAWTLDGKMIDAPVVGRAKAVVARAERCGSDVAGVRERWKGQEPQ